jgi:hypothetical protein
MMMLAASVFLQTGLLRGFSGQSDAYRPNQSRGLVPHIWSESANRVDIGLGRSDRTSGFSNAAVHKKEPAATGSCSGGQT